MGMVRLERIAVGVAIHFGKVRIRLTRPMYWGLLKAIKISRSPTTTHTVIL